MAVKVMGVTCGRKNGNSEILLKEALLYCQEAGAEVTMINLRDYKILDCDGCTSCARGMAQGKIWDVFMMTKMIKENNGCPIESRWCHLFSTYI